MKKWKILSIIYLTCAITFIQAQTYHIVQRGENLYLLAHRYGHSIQQLKSWNNLRSNEIYPGQKLIVGNYTNKYYRVQWGNTLDSIASRYGVSVGWLERVNNISNPYDLKIGQTLIVGQTVPQTYTPTETNYTNKYYRVQWGNTLDSIASRYGVSVGWLERVNNISNPYDLRMGQTLIVGQTAMKTYIPRQAYTPTETKDINAVETKPISSVINSSSVTYYQVKIGDTLTSIAKRFNLDPDWLAKENLITDNQVTPGEIIVIPEVANKTEPSHSETSQSGTWLNGNDFFSSIGHKIIQYADTFIGTPYVYGGTSRNGIDCSGLTQRVYKEVGINLPRTAAEQYRDGKPISLAEAQPGDLIFFHFYGDYVDHVGIYIGDNRFIQAGTYEGRVVIAKLNDYFRRHIAGVRTYFAENKENGNGG
ncbi:MAG: LysM peptidoglycan-binding domain-containing protein [Candidatus Omnitrophica bacterium]|nr:LysM peptidoglycan-binding domain-containing protein [Candidatus Omnitrophota bacterium]